MPREDANQNKEAARGGSDGKPAGGVRGSEEHLGDGVTALLAGAPRFQESACMLCDPRHREDAHAHQHHDGGRPRRDDVFDESLLETRQPQVRSVAELPRSVLGEQAGFATDADDRDLAGSRRF